MQCGKTFTKLEEAQDFAKKHKKSWIHRCFIGKPKERKSDGYHVVYLVSE